MYVLPFIIVDNFMSIKFISEFFNNRKQTGSIMPSSIFLGKEITSKLPSTEGINVLEVGAGTGIFSEILASKMNISDNLIIAEINPSFCEILKQKQSVLCPYTSPKITLQEGNILDYKPDFKFDHIISSLPLNCFSAELSKTFIEYFKMHLKEDGTLSFFEYAGIGSLKRFPINISMKDRRSYYTENISPYIYSKNTVYRNFPPATVNHIKFK